MTRWRKSCWKMYTSINLFCWLFAVVFQFFIFSFHLVAVFLSHVLSIMIWAFLSLFGDSKYSLPILSYFIGYKSLYISLRNSLQFHRTRADINFRFKPKFDVKIMITIMFILSLSVEISEPWASKQWNIETCLNIPYLLDSPTSRVTNSTWHSTFFYK